MSVWTGCPDGSCSSALPRFCDMSCSLAVLAFAADCQAFFGPVQLAQIVDPVLQVCDLTAGDADPTEIGGDQLDHFVIGQLIGCTNLAHGRPATQSSTGYGGEAWKAVDGNGEPPRLLASLHSFKCASNTVADRARRLLGFSELLPHGGRRGASAASAATSTRTS